MKITYINEKFVNHENAFVHIEDRGYQFSDGVYEVILARNNILIDWAQHCTRLRRSLSEMKIGYSFGNESLQRLIRELMDRNSLEDAIIYMQVSRGVAKREHGFPKGNITPSVVITASPAVFPSDEEYKNGVAVITMPDIRWKRRDIKTISLLPNILAKQAASEQNAAEAILIEDNGSITEGSSSNFFIFDKYGTLRTHPANNLILGGITRDGIINVAKQFGIKVEERAFSISDVMSCKGAFVSSTTKHILPVTKINGTNITDGVVCSEIKELMKLYKKYIDTQIEGTNH
jgi:D-alanine transaminase